jgi:hypothetical protein
VDSQALTCKDGIDIELLGLINTQLVFFARYDLFLEVGLPATETEHSIGITDVGNLHAVIQHGVDLNDRFCTCTYF